MKKTSELLLPCLLWFMALLKEKIKMRPIKVISMKSNDEYEVTNEAGNLIFKCDESVKVGGSGKYPRPTDYFLGALGSCLNITARSIAKRKGIIIRKLIITINGNVETHGIVDPQIENRISDIRIRFEMESDLPKVKEERFFQECVTACPVHAAIEDSTKVTWSY